MKYLPYVLKHLRKNWIRTLSTMLAMALCIFLICSAADAAGGVLRRASRTPSTERLVTRNRVSLVFPLPLTLRAAASPRCPASSGWPSRTGSAAFAATASGQPDMKNFFPNFAVEAEPYLAMCPEYELTPPRNADVSCRTGAGAHRAGAGREVRLEGRVDHSSSRAPFRPIASASPFEFVVSAIYRGRPAEASRITASSMMLFHWKYLHEATRTSASRRRHVLRADCEPQSGGRGGQRRSTARSRTATRRRRPRPRARSSQASCRWPAISRSS